MTMKKFWLRALTIGVSAVLAACGGSDKANPVADASAYATAVAQMNSAAGVNSTSLQAAFAGNYLDAGMTRAQVLDALGKDAAGYGTSGFSGLPLSSLTEVAVSACDANNVCTLTGTLTNSDADTTAVPFSTQIVLENGSYRVLGDQKSS